MNKGLSELEFDTKAIDYHRGAKEVVEIKRATIEALLAGDMSLTEIAEKYLIRLSTIWKWRVHDPEFDAACIQAEATGINRWVTSTLAKFDDLDFEKISKQAVYKIMTNLKERLGNALDENVLDIIEHQLLENAIDSKVVNAQVNRLVNQFKSIMLYLSKKYPAEYGDSITVNHTITDARELSPEQREIRINLLLEQRRKALVIDGSIDKGSVVTSQEVTFNERKAID